MSGLFHCSLILLSFYCFVILHFHKQAYLESVPQDLQFGRPVMRISATDIDEGTNSIVRYQLETSSVDQQYFYIDKDNGLIYLNRTIDVS